MSKTLVEVLTEQGLVLQPSSNGRWVAVCPFHEGDRDPSFTVYTHNDSYFCFGCEAWGDPVKFLVDYKGMTFKEAQENVGVDYALRKEEKTKIIKVRDTSRLWSYLGRVSQIYHAQLLSTQGAYTYLTKRGLSDATIRDYNLGYTDGRVLRIDFADDFRIARDAGLINNQGYEVLSHRITIPNRIGRDNVDFIMGRTVTNDRIKYLGLRLPKPMYGFAMNAKSPILFMAEGQFDWLLLQQWGYPAIVLSGSHLARWHLMSLRDKMVIIIPDNDDVGLKAALKLHASLTNSYILDYSSLGVKDVGELGLRKDGEESFGQLVKEQEWFNSLSLKGHWMKWFPNSLDHQFSHLT